MTKTHPQHDDNLPKSLTELWQNAQLAWLLFRDQRINPLLRFGIPAVVLAYIIMPIDLVPDLIPGLGQLDDLAVAWMGLRYFLSACPADIVAEHRSGTKTTTSSKKDDKVVDGDYRVVND